MGNNREESSVKSKLADLRDAAARVVDAGINVADAVLAVPDAAVSEYAEYRGIDYKANQDSLRSMTDFVSSRGSDKSRGR